MSGVLSKLTKFVISAGILLTLQSSNVLADARAEILRNAILSSGLRPAAVPQNLSALAKIGEKVFESEALSLNGNISCQQCHLEKFGSADGIPISVGVSGEGTGATRVNSAYRFLPRNSLALWGRGAKDFTTFFWDGRVDTSSGHLVSQFGDKVPSIDPLVVAVHLPPVETVEMLEFDEIVERHRTETVEGAEGLYRKITENLITNEPEQLERLSQELRKPTQEIEFVDVATSIATFLREKFAIRETKLHRFAFAQGDLTTKEIEGGLIFYGKGRCVVCHSGPHFSDFKFHTIPFPQLGQGRNGFGIDYGRFNITHRPDDLYRFRTAPLWDVGNTAPYGHSGSVSNLRDAIRAHFDPLKFVNLQEMNALQRQEFYKYLMASSNNRLSISYLEVTEIDALIEFLATLNQSQ